MVREVAAAMPITGTLDSAAGAQQRAFSRGLFFFSGRPTLASPVAEPAKPDPLGTAARPAAIGAWEF